MGLLIRFELIRFKATRYSSRAQLFIYFERGLEYWWTNYAYNFTSLLFIIGMNVMAGYNLHIERDTEITESEWLAVCKQDKSLAVKNFVSQTNPETGENIKISTPASCVWTTPVLRKGCIFFFSNGRITLGSQSAQIKKAKLLAKQLNAKVVGDEGEEY